MTEKYPWFLPVKKSWDLLYDTVSSTQRSVTRERGRMVWEVGGGSGGRGHMYPYGRLTSGRNQHNIVKQLSFN